MTCVGMWSSSEKVTHTQLTGVYGQSLNAHVPTPKRSVSSTDENSDCRQSSR